jgi:hypothetical protein
MGLPLWQVMREARQLRTHRPILGINHLYSLGKEKVESVAGSQHSASVGVESKAGLLHPCLLMGMV